MVDRPYIPGLSIEEEKREYFFRETGMKASENEEAFQKWRKKEEEREKKENVTSYLRVTEERLVIYNNVVQKLEDDVTFLKNQETEDYEMARRLAGSTKYEILLIEEAARKANHSLSWHNFQKRRFG